MGGGTRGPVVRLGVVGHVGRDAKEGGGNPCMIPKADHGEEGADKHRRDVGYDVSRKGVEGGWDADSSYVHWP